ncbi:sirohydrochlorin cobaltochelatase [Paratissierella segnis]|jgi:sirohydrochlorin cobaltochelatase|uniref:Sirohydrochlorin cobaltochelatase n=1 Tax=Paratissierella segnis TaxID=2763679 RepID=A0A926ILK0_9FIRM|nr:sirohydrochlorin cobaltochelatase [Paratissierella segnis]MBC8589455.1 sirohydrochlorin cobaltochelatase [Paratissierella segnis]
MNKGIIVTSFGTTYKDTRKLCIESIENRIKEEYPDCLVLRAFTSRVVISRLKERDGIEVDNPTEAMMRLVSQGIRYIYIQPLLMIEGIEYEKLLREARDFIKNNPGVIINIGKPLLSTEKDCERLTSGLDLSEGIEAKVFMGHGSEHKADISYEYLEKIIKAKGYKNIFIGTVEGEKNIDDIVAELKDRSIDKVELRPLMLVAGDHATNDMSSEDESSWKNILAKNNIETQVELKGLGEIKSIQDMFLGHLRDIMR